MKITDLSPNDLKGALYSCAFSTCSGCPLSESTPLTGKALCEPGADKANLCTSTLFGRFAGHLALHVLQHKDRELLDWLILEAIKDMYVLEKSE